jgi:hypothetical protein
MSFVIIAAVVTLLAFYHQNAAAASSVGTASASAQIQIKITIPAVFRIESATRVPGGIAYRVWTNEREITLNGHYIRPSKVGEQTITLPDDPTSLTTDGLTIVNP